MQEASFGIARNPPSATRPPPAVHGPRMRLLVSSGADLALGRDGVGFRVSAAPHRPRMPDLERALIVPASVFRSPEEVVHHPMLSLGRKREILRRWAWDEYLIEVAQGEGMPDGPPSRLDEVKLALLGLEDEWRPHPAAPAAFLPRYDVDRSLLAA